MDANIFIGSPLHYKASFLKNISHIVMIIIIYFLKFEFIDQIRF
jgi:hypothetical protein